MCGLCEIAHHEGVVRVRRFIWIGDTEYEWTTRREDAIRRHLIPLRKQESSGRRYGIYTNQAICGTVSAMPMFNSKWDMSYPCEVCNRLILMKVLAE